jgi:purine-binding chemotaxis protein CheW
MNPAQPAASSGQFCTFTVANHYFGIEVTRVQEVLRQQNLTPVPKAPHEIAGLLNLRGQILPAIDLRKRLGFAEEDDKDDEGSDGPKTFVNVIISSPDGPVDLLADRVGDVLTLDSSTWEPSSEALGGKLKDAVLGLHKLKHELLLVLDPARVVEIDT